MQRCDAAIVRMNCPHVLMACFAPATGLCFIGHMIAMHASQSGINRVSVLQRIDGKRLHRTYSSCDCYRHLRTNMPSEYTQVQCFEGPISPVTWCWHVFSLGGSNSLNVHAHSTSVAHCFTLYLAAIVCKRFGAVVSSFDHFQIMWQPISHRFPQACPTTTPHVCVNAFCTQPLRQLLCSWSWS